MRWSDAPVALVAALSLGASAVRAEPVRYEGLCEASAAARLDATHFAVASDETDTLLVYERGKPAPVSRLTRPGMTDVEASARIGDTVFWLTSHSLTRKSKDKAERKILFATAVGPGPSLTPVGAGFRGLRELVAARLGMAEGELAPTLNIEGLAATPTGELLVGLRAPLDGGSAQVVKIDDPFGLVGLPAPPKSGEAVAIPPVSRLALDGKGIRGLELVGTGGRRFLIVAGGARDNGPTPTLHWWDGVNPPTPGPEPALAGLVPEAAIAWSERELQIIGDNGGACSDKEPGPRWFPSVELSN